MTIYTELDFLGTKNLIAAELNALLGDYIFPASNSTTAKAIAIDISGNYPPKGTVVDIRTNGDIDPAKNGLEVVIRPQVEHSIVPTYSNGKFWTVQSQIIFKQWNPYQNVLEAVERVINNIDLGLEVEMRPRLVRNELVGNIESQTIAYNQVIAFRRFA